MVPVVVVLVWKVLVHLVEEHSLRLEEELVRKLLGVHQAQLCVETRLFIKIASVQIVLVDARGLKDYL